MNRLRINLVVLLCIATPAMAQTRLFTVLDPNLSNGTREKSPMWLGDVNGDQCDDFALGGGGFYGRTVTVFSGTDGKTLFSFDSAGRAALGGDIDGDGTPEILSASTNAVWVHSGRTGKGRILFHVVDGKARGLAPGVGWYLRTTWSAHRREGLDPSPDGGTRGAALSDPIGAKGHWRRSHSVQVSRAGQIRQGSRDR